MSVRHNILALCVTGLVVLAGCGSGSDTSSGQSSSATPTTAGKTSAATTSAMTTSAPPSTKTSIASPTTTAASPPPPTETAAPPTGPVPDTSGTKPWRDLTAGECVGDIPEGTFTEVTLVDCATLHEAEAIGAMKAVTLKGQPAEEAAQAQCEQDLAASGIVSDGLVAAPIVETQGTLLARAVCLVVDATGAPLTGSVVAG